MKITLTEAQTIKARDYDAGDEVIVSKELGERMIEGGLALEDRVIEVPENRTTTYHAHRFTGGKKVFQGSDGKKYVQKGKNFVEEKE